MRKDVFDARAELRWAEVKYNEVRDKAIRDLIVSMINSGRPYTCVEMEEYSSVPASYIINNYLCSVDVLKKKAAKLKIGLPESVSIVREERKACKHFAWISPETGSADMDRVICRNYTYVTYQITH